MKYFEIEFQILSNTNSRINFRNETDTSFIFFLEMRNEKNPECLFIIVLAQSEEYLGHKYADYLLIVEYLINYLHFKGGIETWMKEK